MHHADVHVGWHTPQVRDVSPPNSGSTASAIHLCIRNFVGGCGPLGAHSCPLTARLSSVVTPRLFLFYTTHTTDQHLTATASAAPFCRRGVA